MACWRRNIKPPLLRMRQDRRPVAPREPGFQVAEIRWRRGPEWNDAQGSWSRSSAGQRFLQSDDRFAPSGLSLRKPAGDSAVVSDGSPPSGSQELNRDCWCAPLTNAAGDAMESSCQTTSHAIECGLAAACSHDPEDLAGTRRDADARVTASSGQERTNPALVQAFQNDEPVVLGE